MKCWRKIVKCNLIETMNLWWKFFSFGCIYSLKLHSKKSALMIKMKMNRSKLKSGNLNHLVLFCQCRSNDKFQSESWTGRNGFVIGRGCARLFASMCVCVRHVSLLLFRWWYNMMGLWHCLLQNSTNRLCLALQNGWHSISRCGEETKVGHSTRRQTDHHFIISNYWQSSSFQFDSCPTTATTHLFVAVPSLLFARSLNRVDRFHFTRKKAHTKKLPL